MHILRNSVAVGVAVCLAVSTATAQVAHVADQSALNLVLSERVAQDEADRAVVHRVLNHPHLQTVAGRLGVDLIQAQAAVSTLEGSELQALAAQAQYVDSALAGGQSTITLSTTTIIIGLLVLVLIIVAVK